MSIDKRPQIKQYLFAILIAMPSMAMSGYFYPTSPEYPTMIWQNQSLKLSTCPELNPIGNGINTHSLDTQFTLLNWNIYKQQNESWLEKLQQWSQQADLITLQEAKYNDELVNYSQNLNLHSIQNVAFYYEAIALGVNTISRVEPKQVCGTSYSEPWIRVPKSALATTYSLQGTDNTLLLLNLHGVNFTFTSTPLHEQFIPYLQLIKNHRGPVIISGDFNTWTDTKNRIVKQALKELGFQEVTYASDYRKTAFGHPLDHVWYRQLSIVKAESLPTNASDHSPQIVTFSQLDK